MPNFLDDESPQDQLKRLIAGYSQPAAPQTPVSSPIASPVAVPNDSVAPVVTKPVSVPPVASGTEDLEKQEAANVATAHPVSVKSEVTPLAQQQAYDQSRLSHLQSSGAGEDRLRTGRDANGTQIMGADGTPKKAHPILGTIAKIGDIGLSSLFPTIAAQIPGTAMYHNRAIDNAQADVTADVKNEDTAATAAHLDAETANLQNPPAKDTEEWAPLPGVQGPNGQPILHEKHSNQLKFGELAGVQPIKPPNEKPDSIDQQYSEAIARGDHQAAARLLQVKADMAKAGQTPERQPKQLAVGPDGTVIELRPGVKVPQGTKTVSGDLAGSKPSADEQKRADLVENLNENLNQLEDIVKRRPELFGKVAGRMTSAREWMGSNDQDVAALKGIEDRLGMVQQSSHGMRSAQHVEASAQSVLNGFKNGPEAMMRSIADARASGATFTQDVERAKSGGNQNGAPAKMIRARDPQGKLHEAPEGSPLPAGWKAE